MAYIFDPSKGETPESAARKRAFAEAIMGQAMRGGAPKTIGDGLTMLGQSLSARIANNAATKEQKAGQESANSVFNSIVQGIIGGAGAPSAMPSSLEGTPADQPTDYSASTTPQRFTGSQKEFVSMLMPAAMEASKRTGVDPRIIVAQAAQETGWGRSAPGNNFFGIKSHGQGGGQNLATHEYVDGKRVNVKDSFRTFASPDESVAGYADFILKNPRYKPLTQAEGLDAQLAALQESGYATDPNYSRSVGSIARGIQVPSAPTQVASLDPSAGIAQATDSTEAVTAFAAGDTAPPMAPPRTVADRPVAQPQPVQTAQADIPLPQLLQAANNPWLNEQQRAVVNMLIKRQMDANDPSNQLDMEYKRAQISKLGRDGSSPAELGLNPQYGVDASGNPVLIQIGKDGKAVQTALPDGVKLSKEPIKLDAGTHFVLLDPITRQPVGQIPKENYEEAFQKGEGGAAGKAQAEAAANLPTDLATAEQAVSDLDALIAHPGLSSIAGPLDQYRPSWTMDAEGRDALARFNQAKGRAFLQAFGMLKGGGQITEVEGLKAEQAMARMDRAQGENEFKQALQDFRDAVATGMDKLRQRAGQAPASPAPRRLRYNPATGELE